MTEAPLAGRSERPFDDDRLLQAARDKMAAVLAAAVPSHHQVLADCSLPVRSSSRYGQRLHPDLAVRRRTGTGEAGSRPPVLCVTLTASVFPPPRQDEYARLGVDHYWIVNLRRIAIEVFVRTGSRYRHAESLTGDGEWADFGIAVVQLDVPRLLQ